MFSHSGISKAGADEGFTVKAVPILNGAAYCVIYANTD